MCDAGGRLLAFQRMDGASGLAPSAAKGKAMASAAFGRPSGEYRRPVPSIRPCAGIAAAEGNHMFYGGGAVPIFAKAS